MSIFLAIMIFGVLIFVHELGHFFIAKVNDVKVHEFSLGMGPRILNYQKEETEYSLRILPIGGYVKMAGMDPEDEEDPRGFNKKSVLQRMAVIFAGPLMNFITALLFFVLVFMVVGIPSNSPVIQVISGHPAEKAGIESGDKILQINETKVTTWEDVVKIIHAHPNEKVELSIKRDEKNLKIMVTPELDEASGKGLIGITQSFERQGFIKAINMGITQAYQFTKLLIGALFQMITGAIEPELAGPVGVVQMVGEAARVGIASVLTFAGILSINLGLINLFPIPALDGSRLIFLGIEGLRGRPIDPAKENFIHLIGFALLMLLMIVITYQDILRVFS